MKAILRLFPQFRQLEQENEKLRLERDFDRQTKTDLMRQISERVWNN